MPIFASNRLSDAATPVLGTLASVFCASRKLNRRDAEKIAISFWPLAKSQELKAKSDFHGRRFGAEGGATSDKRIKTKETKGFWGGGGGGGGRGENGEKKKKKKRGAGGFPPPPRLLPLPRSLRPS